jgi:hypothetical protein
MGLAVLGAACEAGLCEDFCDPNALAQACPDAAVMTLRGRDNKKMDEDGSAAERSDPQNAA